jgi:hypothetical protein
VLTAKYFEASVREYLLIDCREDKAIEFQAADASPGRIPSRRGGPRWLPRLVGVAGSFSIDAHPRPHGLVEASSRKSAPGVARLAANKRPRLIGT